MLGMQETVARDVAEAKLSDSKAQPGGWRGAVRAGLGFAVVAIVLVALVALSRGGAGFTWQSVLGAAVGGFFAGLVVEWVRADQNS